MRIKKIILENFKKFQHLEVEFQELDCLVGSNNSGKSTLLQSLALFDFCLHQCLSKTNGKAITLKSRSISEEDFVVLPVTRGIDLWYDKITQTAKKHILIAIEVIFDNNKSVRTTLDFNFNRFSIKTETEPDVSWLEQLKDFKISYLPVFSTFQTKEEKRTQLAVRNELSRGNVNAVIRNLLLSLKEENRDKKLIEILQRSFPSIKKINIEFDEANMQYILVTYQEEGKRKEFDIFSAGSGFQQFIYLFGFVLLEQPNIVLLDEPDVHLHGQLQKALLHELTLLTAQEQKQVLFATHSRDLISNVNPENILSLSEGTAQRLQLDYHVFNTLESLGSIENIQLVVLQEFRRVLVVENREDWDFIQHLGNLLLGESKMLQIAKRLAVCYSYGNPGDQNMPAFRKSLQDMFTKQQGELKMFVVADRDYFPHRDELIDDFSKKDERIVWYIWQRNEIQNYFISETAFVKLVKPKPSSQITIEEVALKNKLEELIQSQKDDIQDRMVTGFEKYSKKFKKGWDSSRFSKEAREFHKKEWENDPLAWVDAKKIMANLLTWLQQNKHEQFSEKKLLQTIDKNDLPDELNNFMQKLAKFAGIPL